MRKLLSLLLWIVPFCLQAQININIRYSAPDNGAIKYMNEMISSGLADEIRAIPGCLRYDYFIPQDNPSEVLLMDSWEDQAALNRYHSSEVMKKAEALRTKYNIQRNAQMQGAPRPQPQVEKPLKADSTMIVRISEIEVYPEYLEEYLEFAHNVAAASVRNEPGVICIYPMQQLRDECQIRILEIYASQEAYQRHITTAHFQTYKQGTLHMVKKLDLVDMSQMAPETLELIFNKAEGLKGDWPKGNPNDAYAQYFKGNSFLAPIQPKNLKSEETPVLGYANVTFEPGCRNNWHVHHGAHQILICVGGEGIYQEWGKQAIRLKAGDIIDIPEGVKHWHGATRDSWFQHLASHVHVSQPASDEWMEAVSNAQYEEANR